LFTEEEEIQLRTVFSLSAENLKLVLDVLCYIFEQAAFTSTGPEQLFSLLQEAGFAEAHAKVRLYFGFEFFHAVLNFNIYARLLVDFGPQKGQILLVN